MDTRTEQQKEIDEAIANGTWGIEYADGSVREFNVAAGAFS